MKRPKHTESSHQIREKLATWGFSQEVQQRIGAFAVVWGVFESNLETTLWALRGESVEGARPSTDKVQVGNWIDELGNVWPKLNAEANEVLSTTSLAAVDLMDYRHAIMHGTMIPNSTMPTFIRNPRWYGEERKRITHSAQVDTNLLDMAIDCAWILCRVVFAIRAVCTEPAKLVNWTTLKKELARARSEASELRHLSELMNHEKY